MNVRSCESENMFPYVIKEYAKAHKIPVSATIELTPFCNFSCVMCYVRLTREQAKKQGELMSAEQILSVARQAKDMGTLYLTLTGGEPLTRPDFWGIYSELNKMGFLISILSNGSMIDDAAMKNFEEYGMPYSVKITLYGATNDTYKRVCNSDCGFSKAENAVRLLKKAGVPLYLTATIVRENAEDLPLMYKKAHEWGVPLVPTASVVKSARGAENSAENSRFLFEEFAEMLSFEQLEKNKIPKKDSPFAWCSSYGTSFWLTWNGHLQLCAFMNGPYAEINGNLEAAWNKLNSKLDVLKNPDECKNCEYSEFCQRCPGMMCAESGSAEKASASVCNTAKCLYTLYKRKLEE